MLEHASFSFEATERSKSMLEHASFSFEATARSNSLLERALKPLTLGITARACFFSFESTFDNASFSFGSTFDNASFSFEFPFEIALLRTVPCFELYFVRLHRRRKAPYANLVYIDIYIYMGGSILHRL